MSVPTPTDALLIRLAALGPFFLVHAHAMGAPVQPPWRSMRELAGDRAVLLHRVRATRAWLATHNGGRPETVELRVAASTVHLGVSARVVSPALALAVLAGVTEPLDLDALRWQDRIGGAFPLSMPRERLRRYAGAGWPAEAGRHVAAGRQALRRWADALVAGPLCDLVTAVAALPVPARVLWGNVASAVHGAATMLGAASPAHAEPARRLAALLLEHPALRGAATGAPGTPEFRRRSCCLIYRAAPGAVGSVCADCVLTEHGNRHT